jgi:hypothetical protein
MHAQIARKPAISAGLLTLYFKNRVCRIGLENKLNVKGGIPIGYLWKALGLALIVALSGAVLYAVVSTG